MSHKKKSGKKKRLILIGAVLICIFLCVWTIWGNKAVIMSEFSVSSPRLPSLFSGYCIAQVSDLHNTEFGEGNTTLLQMLSCGAVLRCGTFPSGGRFLRQSNPEQSGESKYSARLLAGWQTLRPQARCRYVGHTHAN